MGPLHSKGLGQSAALAQSVGRSEPYDALKGLVRPLKGLVRPLRASLGPQVSYKALKCLTSPLKVL